MTEEELINAGYRLSTIAEPICCYDCQTPLAVFNPVSEKLWIKGKIAVVCSKCPHDIKLPAYVYYTDEDAKKL